jgi:hypothetical protein
MNNQHVETISSLEILVSDNASDDSTPSLIAEFAKSNPKVKTFRQASNLGFRGNMEFLASQAAGEWILYMSCGDTLIPDYDFRDVFEMCRQTTTDTIFYNYEMLDVQTGRRFRNETSALHDQVSQSDLIYSAAPFPLFKTDRLKEIILDQKPLTGDWWPQIEWALAASSKSGLAAYMELGPLTGNRPSAGWWSKPFAFAATIEMAKLLQGMASRHAASVKLLTDAKKTWQSLPLWVFQTKVVFGNSATLQDFRLLAPNVKHAPVPVIASLLILLTPTVILEGIRQLTRRFQS